MLNGFTFDGINSLDYGFYISSASVYDAPKRVVEMTDVPGKNGALAVDTGRFENIEVKYHVYSVCDTQEEFSENIQAFRSAVCSRYDYVRLTDDYNAGEYRLALYKDGLSVNAPIDRYGGFDVVFECKPQRFLTAGETEKTISEWSDLHTDSGSLVTIDNSSGEYAVKSLSTDIEPQQDLNGYDNPWAGGAGKNLIDDRIKTVQSASTVVIGQTSTSTFDISLTAGTYTISFTSEKNPGVYIRKSGDSGNTTVISYGSRSGSFTLTSNDTIRVWAYLSGGITPSDITTFQLESGSSPTSYAPYENICPITGFDSANVYVSPTTSVGDATTYNVSFGSAGTVYGGTLDVVSGQLTVTRIFRQAVASELDSSHWAKGGATNFDEFYIKNTADTYGKTGENYGVENIRCSHAPSLSSVSTTQMFTRLSNREARIVFPLSMGINSLNAFYTWNQTQIDNNKPLQFCYVLQTPVTYQLTATQVALLLGTNNVWSDTGDIQIEYGKGGYTLYNPTPFDSLPLIKVTGTGTLGIGSWLITITGTSGQIIYIDCDIMDAYKITGGIIESANNLVSFNKVEFPRLVSGLNNFSVGTGITEVKVIPRWWRV